MSRIQTTSHTFRYQAVKISFLLIFIVLIGRLYYLQIEAHGRFAALAEKQHWIGKEIPAKRGKIVSSDGYALSTNISAYSIFAVPREILDPEKTATTIIETIGYESNLKIDKELGLTPEEIVALVDAEKETHVRDMQEMLNQKDLLYVPIAQKQEESVKNKIEEIDLPGIYFERDYKRFYPEGTLASHVLGFVGKNDLGDDQGYYGIEGYFNGDLKGISGRVALEKDAVGRPIPVGEYLPTASDDGRDIVLTINRELQYQVEKKLKEGVERYDAQDGTVIVMEPQTGKILAMASYPNYNPGLWADWTVDLSDKAEDDLTDEEKMVKKYGDKIFYNLAVADVYEPGSIFKPITISVALEEDKMNINTVIESAPYPVSIYTIKTWNDKYYGPSLPAEILQHSDNTGMARISQMIGVDTFYGYITKCGFGSITGIELEDEANSWIRESSEWKDVDLATAAFGQGLSVTPIQMMQAYTTFINDGVMISPYIVEEIKTETASLEFGPKETTQLFSKTTADTIVDMLVSVVEKGEFKFAVLPGYKIAGKTGTAQIAKDGRYDTSQTNTTFIGFAPASDPKFLMIVKLTRPTASTYSAETAVPLWMNIAEDLFVYFGVMPIE